MSGDSRRQRFHQWIELEREVLTQSKLDTNYGQAPSWLDGVDCSSLA
jgi:hypothetical protein